MKKILIVGHTRSGGHFLMNSIALNFEKYQSHKRGQDFCKKSGIPYVNSALDKIDDDKTILIGRQQAYSFGERLDLLEKDYHVFYMMRDGRDVMASLYEMHTSVYRWSKAKTLEEFLSIPFQKESYENIINFKRAENPVHSWVMHCQSWMSIKNIQTIHYEQLFNNYETTLNRIATILGMKRNKEIVRPEKTFNSVAPRKGAPGQYKEFFSEEMEKEFFQAAMKYQISTSQSSQSSS